MLIAGTAVALLIAGVAIQVARPTSAYPEDGAGAKGAAAGRATTSDAAAQGGQRQKAVSKVGNQIISYDELAAECVNRYGKEILDNLINRRIIQQACDAQGIEVAEAEIEAEILKTAQKFGLDKMEWEKMLQAERNVSPSQNRRDIIWPMLALKKLAGEEVEVTKEDINKAFVRNYGARVKARAIVMDNQRRANEVWTQAVANPDEFGRLAREHSIDPSSRPLEGMIPPIPKYAGSPDLEKAAFKLKEGEISAVIQVGLNQFIILMCEGRTEPTVTNIAEVKDILVEQLREEKVQESVARVFSKLKDEARVDNYLTGVSSGGERKTNSTRQGANGTGPVRQTGAAGASRNTAKPIADDEGEQAPPARPKGTSRAPKTR
ncbi:MAG: peptidylprolyl isomerase [Planctomycetales bacterium]